MPKIKRYVIFAWESYEAIGGWNDFYDDADTIEECISKIQNDLEIKKYDCVEVFDLKFPNNADCIIVAIDGKIVKCPIEV